MDDCERTRDELLSELERSRRRIEELEAALAHHESTESALWQSEDRFRSLVETIPHGIQECDTTGRITFANAAYHRMNGYVPGRLIGETIWKLLATEESQRELQEYIAYLVEKQPPPSVYVSVNRRKDGSTYDIQVDWDYRRNADGSLAGFIAIVTDITQRKQADENLRRGRDELEHRVHERNRELAQANEELTREIAERKLAETAARESEDHYRRIFDAVADGLLLVGKDGRINEANQAACELYGYRAEEMNGLPVAQLIHPKDRHLFADVYQRITDGSSAHVEAENLRKDGSSVFVELRANIFEFRRRKQALCVIRDLTARKQAERALEESEKRFRLAFEEGPLGMVLGDRHGRIATVNRALCEMLGYSPAELESAHIDDLTHPDDRDLNRWFLQQLREQETPHLSVEKRYLCKSGEVIWGRVTAANLPGRPGETGHAFAMIEDITEQKVAQKAVEEEQHNLRRLLEMHEHDRQLVAYEIHDGFVQTLVGARMLLDMPRKQLSPEMIERFEKAVVLLDRTIQEARRLISGQRPLILDERGLMAAIEYLVCERQTIDGPKIDYRDAVAFDRLARPLETAVFRVIQEGLNNAEQHSQSPRIRIGVIQLGDRLRVEIEDWGVGFNPTCVGRGCFGLEGLRERARIFGGTARVDSEPGRGTTVTVEFPILERADESTFPTSETG